MWRQITFSVDESCADALSDDLTELGALSVSFDDDGDQPLFEPGPGETPLWHRTRVTGLFEPDVNPETVFLALAARYPGDVLNARTVTELEDQIWERAWLEHFKPMRFGSRLWVCPGGFEPPEPDAVNILLDPGLAFGTGTHPTTALCLEWLEGQNLVDKTVMDYGCGSGILAVAALKLGAAQAYAVDIDPQALTATTDNALKNCVEDRLTCALPRTLSLSEADIVVANILAGPLAALADDLIKCLPMGGLLALSGILATQAETVISAYQPRIHFEPPVQREDWVLLAGVRVAD
ncbi:MAG: 50S ribosomal protein L11 methyltransferase [Methylococcaceae bacterium]